MQNMNSVYVSKDAIKREAGFCVDFDKVSPSPVNRVAERCFGLYYKELICAVAKVSLSKAKVLFHHSNSTRYYLCLLKHPTVTEIDLTA